MTAVLAAAALGITTMGTIAATPAYAGTVPTAAAAKAAALSPDAAASLQAKKTGKPVVVTADETATDTVTANVNGSFTLDRSELPTRAKKNDAWVPVSAALVKNSDGTLSPAAVNTTLAFSGGGTAPLVSFNDEQGHTLSLTWPDALPVPTISADAATYANVYPGADLAVTATADGGFTDVIVIHDAAAAANPALANIKLGTHTTGMNLTTGTDGVLTATDSKTGAKVFTAPPASIWDSTTAPEPAGKTKMLAAAGGVALSALDQASASTAQVPGSAAHRAAVKVTAGPGTLTLAADQAALIGQGAPSFPEFLDPAVTVGRQDWDYVSQSYPNQPYWDGAGSQKENIAGTEEYVARVGFNNADSTSNGWAWSYFDFDFSSLAGTDVTGATLQLTEVAASQPSVAYTMYAAASGPITPSTDYSGYPGPVLAAHSVQASGTGQYNMDITGDVQWFLGQGGGVLTYKVYETSTNTNSYRWLADNPTVAVTYWNTPAVPSSPTITTGGLTVPCSTNSASPTLIAKSTGNLVSLNVTSSTPDVGYPILANDYISTNGAAAVLSSTPSITAQSGSNTLTLSNYALADGDTYTWYATATNTVVPSAADATCYFKADETSPVMSAVTSTSFPAQGGGETQGQAGSFTFTATDPGSNPVGIASFHYNLGGTFTGSSSVNTTTSSATATLAPPNWGTNTLWVAAVDAAGNQSQPLAYSFFVPAPAYHPGVTGDITSTGKADLLAIDDAGNLRIYPDPQPANVGVSTGTPAADPLQAGGSILINGVHNPLWPNATFTGSLIAHGGSFSGNNVDDLMVLHNGTFYIVQNLGSGASWGVPVSIGKAAACTVPSGFTYASCGTTTPYNSNWSAVKQMIDVPPATASGRPGLITIEENAGVWGVYYYAATPTGLDFTSPVLLSVNSSAWNWGSVTPVYAGDVNGDGKPDLMVRTSTGAIDVFSNIEAGVNQDPSTALITVGNTGSAYTPNNYPYITSDQAVYNGDPTLWAVSANGTLTAIPVTPGATPAFGTPVAISSSGWGTKLQDVENSSVAPDNTGVTADGVSYSATNSFDGQGSAFSSTALKNAFTVGNALTGPDGGVTGMAGIYDQSGNSISGLQPDATVITDDGAYFTWPGNSPNTPDNYATVGQTIAAPVNLSNTQDNSLSFLGAASGNNAGLTGTATLTWSDGFTQNITLSFNDWALGGGTPASPNPVIGSVASRDTNSGGTQAIVSYLFEDTVALSPPTDGAQLAAITLPSFPAGETMHIFSVSTQTVAVTGSAPTITSPATASFLTGVAGSYGVVTTGSPAPTVTETGALPAGLTFTAGSGTATISGTATAAGTYPVTISASNAAGTAFQTLTITVTASQAPAITSAGTATFTSGTAGSYNVTTTGTPTPAVTESGTLPAGLTFAPGTGTASITGTATTVGTYPVTIKATSAAGTATLPLTITVTGPAVVPTITSAATTTFTSGTAGTYTVTTTGTPSPAVTESGSLPAGLTFNTGTGTATITGTATTAGSYPVTITATNSAGHATLSLTITVSSSAPTPTHEWALSTGSGSTVADLTGSDTMTLNSGYSWVTGTPRGTVVGFDGNSAYGETAANAVNTGGSFTVSAWVDLASLPSGNVTAVSEFGNNNSPFYLQYNSGSWAFALSNNDTASPSIDGPNGPNTVVAGTWYHIVGVYNASTHTAYIYVGGTLVGSESGLTTWSSTGDLDVGRDLYTGLQVDYFPGEISTVETWNSALTATQIASLS